MPIDTLKIAKRLRDAGFSEPQAEAVTAAVQEGAASADLATKADLALLRAESAALEERLDARIDALEQRLIARIDAAKSATQTAIEAAKADMLFRMLQMILAAVLINIVAMAGPLFAFAKLLGR